jgi:hypothetical protein
MPHVRYVVWMGENEGDLKPKVFEARANAAAFAAKMVDDKADTAEIFSVEVDDEVPDEKVNGAAIAGLLMSAGHYLESRSASGTSFEDAKKEERMFNMSMRAFRELRELGF